VRSLSRSFGCFLSQAILIRGDLNDLADDDRIRHRTKHMQDRSNHSIDGLGGDQDEDYRKHHDDGESD